MKTIGNKVSMAAVMSVLALAGMVLSGCGGKDDTTKSVANVDTGKPSAGSAPSAPPGGGGSVLAYAKCMREKGIADFPDPDANGMINMNGNKVDTNSAQFKAADSACKGLLPLQGQGNVDPSVVQKASLEYAKCMRDKGVTKFPDPNAQGGFDVDGDNLGVDPNGSIFKSADAACQPILQKAAGGKPMVQSSPQQIGK